MLPMGSSRRRWVTTKLSLVVRRERFEPYPRAEFMIFAHFVDGNQVKGLGRAKIACKTRRLKCVIQG